MLQSKTSEQLAFRRIVLLFFAIIGALSVLCLSAVFVAATLNAANQNRGQHEETADAEHRNSGILFSVRSDDGSQELRAEAYDEQEEPWLLWPNAESALAGLTLLLVLGTLALAVYTALLWSEAKSTGENTARILTEVERGVIYFPQKLPFKLFTFVKGEPKSVTALVADQDIYLRIAVQNFGKASAIIEEVAAIWCAGFKPKDVLPPKDTERLRDISRLVPQGTKYAIRLTRLPLRTDWDTLNKIRSTDSATLYVYGYIRYRTLGESWDQGFLLRWIGPREESELAEALAEGFLRMEWDSQQFWTVKRSPSN